MKRFRIRAFFVAATKQKHQNEGEKAGIDTLGALALRALCGEQTHAPASFARARSLVLKRPCLQINTPNKVSAYFPSLCQD
jgi:hypothetical protein